MHCALFLAVVALPFLRADALKCSTTARCGTQSKNTLTCKDSIFGNCCSKSGYCGSSSAYCGQGCQVGFGDCKSSISASVKPSSTSAKPSSISTKSSSSSAKVIVVSIGSTSESSKSSSPSFTSTLSTLISPPSTATPLSSPTSSSLAPSGPTSSLPTELVSTDGTCGGTQGFTCSGSSFGNCCSEYGWCGSTSIYCHAGCNAAFGKCDTATVSAQPSTSSPASSSSSLVPSSFVTSTRTTSASPSSTQVISTNGQCGASFDGMTCLGSQYGDCCSQYAYCGSTSAFCGTGCQSGFGKCDTPPAPGNTCGVEGFANKAEYYASSFNLIPTADVSTCASLCLAEATCMSYIFNVDLQNCAYLTFSLSEGEFIATTGTNQLFWDRACAEATTI